MSFCTKKLLVEIREKVLFSLCIRFKQYFPISFYLTKIIFQISNIILHIAA